MKRKWRKTLSATMAVLLAAAPMGSIGTKTWAQENGTHGHSENDGFK